MVLHTGFLSENSASQIVNNSELIKNVVAKIDTCSEAEYPEIID